jgi:hypothetical protein
VEAEIGQSMMPSAASLPKGVPNPNDPRVKAAQSVGIDPKVILKTSPSGTTGSQKLVIPGFDNNKPKAEIEITQSPKKKRTRSHNNKSTV